MNIATLITLYAGTLISFIGVLAIPAYLRHRQKAKAGDRTAVASWEGITRTLQEERDRLQAKLDAKDALHQEEMRRRDQEWQTKVDALSARIAQQQTEIDNLYRRLGQEK
jgi:hypothetical protein